jgi:hypothetical protein
MRRRVALVLPFALGIAACGQDPVAPERAAIPQEPLLQAGPPPRGTGLVLHSLTGVSLPIVGQVDELTIDQVVINEIILGNVIGGIVGLEVTGTINGTIGAVGTPVVDQQFTSTLSVTPGPGGCRIVTVDLGPLNIDALGLVTADVPEATVEGKGSGAVGSLLCTLGSLVSGVVGGATRGVQGVLNALNRLI